MAKVQKNLLLPHPEEYKKERELFLNSISIRNHIGVYDQKSNEQAKNFYQKQPNRA